MRRSRIRPNKKTRKKGPQTRWEAKFYTMLVERGIKFKCNKRLKCSSGKVYVPDFMLDCGVVVEIDGRAYHASEDQKIRDRWREAEMKRNGVWKVLRLWNVEVGRGCNHPKVRAVLDECLRCSRGDLVGNLMMDTSNA